MLCLPPNPTCHRLPAHAPLLPPPLLQATNSRLLEEVEALKQEVAEVTSVADQARWVGGPGALVALLSC
jgi:hypothetical protein